MSKNMINVLKVIQILFFAGVIGGLIAYAGNKVGRYIGRKKLSIFKLRPRHTSTLITILSGVAVAVIVLGAALIFSEPIKVLLLDLEKMKEELRTTEKRLEQVKAAVNKATNNYIVYSKGDVIIGAAIPKINTEEESEEYLKALISKTNEAAIKKSRMIAKIDGSEFKLPKNGKLVAYDKDNFDEVARKLRLSNKEMFVFIRTAQNAILGMPFVINISNPFDNETIYRKNDIIAESTLDGKDGYLTIYSQLMDIIRQKVTRKAVMNGLFPNPEDSTIGEYDQESLKDLAKEINRRGKPVTVEFYSAEDTKTMGPLKLKFRLKE